MKSILFSLALMLGTAATAQNLALSVSGAYNTKYSNPGMGIGLDLQLPKSTIGFHTGFDFPATRIIESVGINTTTGKTTIIKAEQTSRVNTYYFKGNYLFMNEMDDTFFPYVTLGFGLVNFNNTTNVVLDFDQTQYRHGFPFDKNDNSVSNIFAGGGLGAQYSLGNVKVFGEARYHLPLSGPRPNATVYGIDPNPTQSAFFNVNVGVAYALPLGGR